MCNAAVREALVDGRRRVSNIRKETQRRQLRARVEPVRRLVRSWRETFSARCTLRMLPHTSKNRAEAGARASTIKVVAAAIAHNHKDAGFDAPLQQGVARTVLEELTQDDSPGPIRALPLDLDCYLAIRKTAYEPRSGRGGRMERVSNARRRGALDVAMIGLMRDARLRVSEAAALTWADLEQAPDGSGRAPRWTVRLPSGERRYHETAVVGAQARQ